MRNISDFVNEIVEYYKRGENETEREKEKREYYKKEYDSIIKELTGKEKRVEELDKVLSSLPEYIEIKKLWRELAFLSRKKDFCMKMVMEEIESKYSI